MRYRSFDNLEESISETILKARQPLTGCHLCVISKNVSGACDAAVPAQSVTKRPTIKAVFMGSLLNPPDSGTSGS